MIAPLRRRHRWLTALLALVVPVLYVAALLSRPADPAVEELPAALAANPRPGEVSAELGNLASDPQIAVRVRGDGDRWWLELDPAAPVTRPETLVYWAPSAPGSSDRTATDRVPDDAFLIGALGGARARAFALPERALGRAGRLMVYSLGHQEVFATLEVPAVGSLPVVEQPAMIEEQPPGQEPTEETEP